MQKGKYTALFIQVINNPSGKVYRIPKFGLEKVRVGLAKLKAIYNQQSTFANQELGSDEMRVLEGNFKYNDVTSPGTPEDCMDVEISLVKQSEFEFEIIDLPQDLDESKPKRKLKIANQ